MKRILPLTIGIAAALALAGAASAQTTPASSTTSGHPGSQAMPAMQGNASPQDHRNAKVVGQTTFNSSKGTKVVIKSKLEPLPNKQQPPSFESLAGPSGKYITRSEASSYPLLANDFEHADLNRDGHISRAEYEHWLKE